MKTQQLSAVFHCSLTTTIIFTSSKLRLKEEKRGEISFAESNLNFSNAIKIVPKTFLYIGSKQKFRSGDFFDAMLKDCRLPE